LSKKRFGVAYGVLFSKSLQENATKLGLMVVFPSGEHHKAEIPRDISSLIS